jgi:hypothetical protein
MTSSILVVQSMQTYIMNEANGLHIMLTTVAIEVATTAAAAAAATEQYLV